MGYSPWGRKSRTRLSDKTATTTYTLICSRKAFQTTSYVKKKEKKMHSTVTILLDLNTKVTLTLFGDNMHCSETNSSKKKKKMFK